MERSRRGEWTALPGAIPARDDTWYWLGATSKTKESGMLKKVKTKATQILVGSAELYRELAISAFRLVPRR
jgi:hypothetical protein